MALYREQQGSWRHYTSVSLGTTAAVPNGDMLNFQGMSNGTIYATSTHGTPTLTYWAAASSTGTFRLLKTSTGGAVSQVLIANAANRMPASLAGCNWIRLSSSTTAAYKSLSSVVLRK